MLPSALTSLDHRSGTLAKLALVALLVAPLSHCVGIHVGRRGDSAPRFMVGEFADDYGSKFSISNTEFQQRPRNRFHVLSWNASGQYLIARNDSSNAADKGLYTRIDWVQLNGMAPWEWAFCFSAYRARTASEAESTTVAKHQEPRTGCNGYPFTRMKRAEAAK